MDLPVSEPIAQQVTDEQPIPPRIEGYRYERFIGRGGMGVVWQAEHLATGRSVAVKFQVGAGFGDKRLVRRFEREAITLTKLKHPGIVAIHDFGGVSNTQYLVMEYVEGELLTEYLERVRPAHSQRLAIIKKIVEAVSYAHQNGVIHRDLKPGNILLDADNQPRIIDFGLARLADDASLAVTQDASPVGTVKYMSPEQIAGQNCDTRCDVFALGLILVEVLTGHHPLKDVSDRRAIEATICEGQINLRQALIGLPHDLCAIIRKCLEVKPEERYTNAGDLLADLVRFEENQPVTARDLTILYFLGRFLQRHRQAVTVATFVVLAGIALLTWNYISIRIERDAAVQAEARAVSAEKDARKSEAEALAAAEAARRALYGQQISLAASEIQAGNLILAAQVLNETDEHMRHWEWSHLMKRCQPEIDHLIVNYDGVITKLAWDGTTLLAHYHNSELWYSISDHTTSTRQQIDDTFSVAGRLHEPSLESEVVIPNPWDPDKFLRIFNSRVYIIIDGYEQIVMQSTGSLGPAIWLDKNRFVLTERASVATQRAQFRWYDTRKLAETIAMTSKAGKYGISTSNSAGDLIVDGLTENQGISPNFTQFNLHELASEKSLVGRIAAFRDGWVVVSSNFQTLQYLSFDGRIIQEFSLGNQSDRGFVSLSVMGDTVLLSWRPRNQKRNMGILVEMWQYRDGDLAFKETIESVRGVTTHGDMAVVLQAQDDGELILRDLVSGQSIESDQLPQTELSVVATNKASGRIALCTKSKLMIYHWDQKSAKLHLLSSQELDSSVYKTFFTAHGNRLFVLTNEAMLIDCQSGQVLLNLSKVQDGLIRDINPADGSNVWVTTRDQVRLLQTIDSD